MNPNAVINFKKPFLSFLAFAGFVPFDWTSRVCDLDSQLKSIIPKDFTAPRNGDAVAILLISCCVKIFRAKNNNDLRRRLLGWDLPQAVRGFQSR